MNIKPNILLVDDRVENLITLENLLDSFDVNLIRALSGEEALAHTLDEDFALILLDVNMPSMDGYEVAEFLRGNSKTKSIPIIFVTAQSGAESHIFKGYESGAIDYLIKPLHPEILKSKVSVFIELYEQKEELRRKNEAFNQQLCELEELQQKLKETNEQLQLLSITDGLTGLYNKRHYEEVFAEEWKRACRMGTALSLIMLDIDHFKLYNDSFGHNGGDDCLSTVSSALLKMELRIEDKVFRVGGEEFAVILPGTDKNGAEIVSKRILTVIEELHIPHVPESGRNFVTASLGYCSVIPTLEMENKQLPEAADKALYQSKHRGRNCASFQEIGR